MANEKLMLGKWVRMTLVQQGVDTANLDIMVSGSGVTIKGEIKKLKLSGFDSAKSQRKLLEVIVMRLRSHKLIKRVRFLG